MSRHDAIQKLRDLAGEVMKLDLGYDVSEHIVYPPLPADALTAALAKVGCAGNPFLEELYGACNGFDLPNVHNGYWIDGVEQLSMVDPEFIRSIAGPRSLAKVIVIGSTGGGDYYVVDLERSSLWYLDHEALVANGIYHDDRGKAVLVADTADRFIEWIIEEVEWFIRG
jgi:hypothetical protein